MFEAAILLQLGLGNYLAAVGNAGCFEVEPGVDRLGATAPKPLVLSQRFAVYSLSASASPDALLAWVGLAEQPV
jgi:hypothetical protein